MGKSFCFGAKEDYFSDWPSRKMHQSYKQPEWIQSVGSINNMPQVHAWEAGKLEWFSMTKGGTLCGSGEGGSTVFILLTSFLVFTKPNFSWQGDWRENLSQLDRPGRKPWGHSSLRITSDMSYRVRSRSSSPRFCLRAAPRDILRERRVTILVTLTLKVFQHPLNPQRYKYPSFTYLCDSGYIQMTLSNTGLNCMGPLICRSFSTNILEIFLKICNNLGKKETFSLAYFVRIQHIIHKTYKTCVSWLFMSLVRLPSMVGY